MLRESALSVICSRSNSRKRVHAACGGGGGFAHELRELGIGISVDDFGMAIRA